MMWWHHGGWSAGDWIGASLLMLLLWAVVIAGIVLLVRSLSARAGHGGSGQPGGQREQPTDALRILDERFARGELTEEEYTHRRALLTSR